MAKANVYIDEGYLTKISKYFGQGKYIQIDLHQFGITMSKRAGYWCEQTYYYTAPPFQGYPPTMEESRRKAGYDRFLMHCKKLPNFIVREGRLQKTDNGFTQKGVDTLLTMDLMELVKSKTEVKTAIVLTSDTDFVPVLNKLRNEDKITVVLYYFNDFIRGSIFSMSNYLLTACDKSFLLSRGDFERSVFIPNKHRQTRLL